MFKRSWISRALWLTIFLFGSIGLVPHAFALEETFSYESFSLTLPDGWVMQDIPKGSEKELIGSLKSQDIPGTSVLILCYKGGRYNYSSVRIIGLKTIASVFPRGQEMLGKQTNVKTDGGLTAAVELWRGAANESGASAFLRAPMGIIETKAGWILMLGFTPDTTGPQLEEAFLKMIQSAKEESESSHGSLGLQVCHLNSLTGDSSAQRW